MQNELLSASRNGAAIHLEYDSAAQSTGPLGAKWSHSYDIAVAVYPGMVTVKDGTEYLVYQLVDGRYVPEVGNRSTLTKGEDGTFFLVFQEGTIWRFNSSGKIAEIIDEKSGNTLKFAYDSSGNLVTIADSAERVTRLLYNSQNRVIEITDPAGRSYAFTYDLLTGAEEVFQVDQIKLQPYLIDVLRSITWPDGSALHYTYQGKGVMTSKTDPLGNVTSYGYDDLNRLISATDPAGNRKSVSYVGESSRIEDANGGGWSYGYDYRNGYLTESSDPLGNRTTYRYDANRNLISKSAPDGSSASYTYDEAGNQLTVTDELGKTTAYTYDSRGQVTSSTNPLGQTTTNSYDEKGRLAKSVDPAGATTVYAYDVSGNLTSVTDPLNRTSTFGYDRAGNRISSTDPTGAKTTFTYDAVGNMLTQTDPLGNTTSFEYDGRDRLIRVTDPLGHAGSYGYDLKGNRVSETDANGNQTRYEYDSENHLVRSVDALGNATAFSYGAADCTTCGGSRDRLRSLTDAKGQTTSYEYDAVGRVTKERDPLGKVVTLLYDSVGNLTSRTDANGATVRYFYDAARHLVEKSYPDGSSESYGYDGAGRMASAANSYVRYAYTYDAAGRITSVADSRGYTISYLYDTAGNRTKMILQPAGGDQRVTTYDYDAGGRLASITSNAGTFAYGYDATGRRTALTYPNHILASYSYDSAGRLTNLTHAGLASFAYTYDSAGNRVSKTYTDTERYFYDSINRLLKVAAPKEEAFSYDAVGNRLSGPGPKDTAYLYNSANQMTQGRNLTYSYDDNGNQISRSVPGAPDKSWTQSWDYENRLVKVEKVKGAERKTVTFSYDPLGRRIGKTLRHTKAGVTITRSWSYVYDNDDIVFEEMTDGSGTTKTFYTHGQNVDEHLGMERNGHFSYYHADALGSIVALTDPSQQVVQRYRYNSFGGMSTSAGSVGDGYAYTGREWDKETGLYYYRARYYDPMQGRFILKDPIAFASGDFNLYAYTSNDPLTKADPYGFIAAAMPLACAGGGCQAVAGAVCGVISGAALAVDVNRLTDVVHKVLERKAYNKRCTESPPPGLDPCARAKWELQRNLDCKRMREEFSRKYYNDSEPGHTQYICNIDKAIEKLRKWIRENCCGK